MRTTSVLRSLLPFAVATVLLTAGCGGDDTAPATEQPPAQPVGPAPSPAADPAAAGTECGPVPAAGGAQAKVVIRGGKVDCAQATDLMTQYFQKVTPQDLGAADGPGPIPLGEWTCGSGPGGDPVTTCSTEDERQVDGVRI